MSSSKTLPVIVQVAFALALSACSAVKATSLPGPTFSGLTSLSLTANGSVQLTWAQPTSAIDTIVYHIYQADLDKVPGGGSLAAKIGNRSVTLHKNFSERLPAEIGTEVGTSAQGTTSFTVPSVLDQSKNYVFQVRAVNKGNGKTDDNNTVLIVEGFGAIAFDGCTAGKGISYNQIEVDFKVPAMASQLNVLRDGQSVFTSADTSLTSFTDTGLQPGHTYQYTCEILLGATTMRGTAPLVLSPMDPFATYKGCVTAAATGSDHVSLSFSQLPPAEKINIYRNGTLAAFYPINAEDLAKGEVTVTIADAGLTEGATYNYSCAAVVGTYEKIGSNKASVTTLATNPPTFAGISQVSVQSPHSVLVSWGVSTGVPASVFNVYATAGAAIDYSTPTAVIPIGTLSTTISGLGDELAYIFAVRACTSTKVCDQNTVALNVPTTGGIMPDAGAPATVGLTAVAKAAGQVTLTAPWTAAGGLVLFRRVLFYCDLSANASTDIGLYSNSQDFPVPNPLVVPTSLRIASMTAFQNQICHFVVQDYDRLNRSNNSKTTASLAIGNLTPPSGFGGISSLDNPVTSSTETTLDVGFTPIAGQSTLVPHGAFQYQIFTATGAAGNACTAGTLAATYPAADYTGSLPVVVKLTGLAANTLYRVCVKAADSDGNLDVNSNQRSKSTLVATPPVFAGLQTAAYNISGVKIDLSWNAATPTLLPVAGYFVRFKVGSTDLSSGYTQAAVPTSVCVNSSCAFSIIPASYPASGLAAGGVTSVAVYACDTFNTVNTSQPANCSLITTANTKQVTVPNLTPPANFYGIKTVTATPNGGARQNGVLQLTWAMNGCAPASCIWSSDYAGFKIYDLNNGMDPINVNCLPNSQGIPDCSVNPVYQTVLTGLVPGKPYNFYVTAINANFIETLTPQSTAISAAGTDTVAPTFPASAANSRLTATFNQSTRTVNLSFDAATDNQAVGAINYSVYQLVQAGTSCAGIVNAGLTASVATTVTVSGGTATASDVLSVSSGGQVYAYRVEATDAQNNIRRATDFFCMYVPDLVPPTFTAKPSAGLVYQSGSSKNWAITWTASDNRSAANALTAKVYVAVSTSKTPPIPAASLFTTGNDANYLAPNQLQNDTNRSSQLSSAGANRYPDATHYVGRDSNDFTTDKYFHYIVIVSDTDNNYVYDTVTLFSPGFHITTFTRSRGTIAGGKLLVVEGAGFTSTTQIYMDNPSLNQLCVPLGNSDNYFELSGRMTDTDPSRVRQFVACTTPAHAAGAVTLYATDSGLTTQSTSSYSYYDPTTDGSPNKCDTSYGVQAGGPLSGSNTAGSPQIVCNRSQLSAVASACDFNRKYITVADNLYFGTTSWTPSSVATDVVDGQNNFMIGMRPSGSNVGLFSYPNGNCNGQQGISFKDLSMVRVKFKAGVVSNNITNAGALVGIYDSFSQATFNNVHVELLDTERTTSANKFGGFMGNGKCIIINSTSNILTSATGTTGDLGGFIGAAKDQFSMSISGSVARVVSTAVNSNFGGFLSYLATGDTFSIQNSNAYVNITTSAGGVGGIVGNMDGNTSSTFQNVQVSGSIDAGPNDAGGLFGSTAGTVNVINATVNADIKGARVGGFAAAVSTNGFTGQSDQFNNLTYHGSLTGAANTGGLFGELYVNGNSPSLTINGVKIGPTTKITGAASSNGTGGLFGLLEVDSQATAQISNAQVVGTVAGVQQVGGFIGRTYRPNAVNLGGQYVQISQSLVKGSVTGTTSIGGMVGDVKIAENTNTADSVILQIKDSYVVGSVSGTSNVGGLAGSFTANGTKAPFYYANFTNDFARVSFPNMGSATSAGRLFGFTSSNKADSHASSVYYDSGYAPGTVLANPIGTGTLNGLTGSGLTSSRFLAPVNFSGWDFSNVWQLANGTYPSLVTNQE